MTTTMRTKTMMIMIMMIRENKIYLVANMGDIKPCNTTDDVSGIPCPPDGHFQYNTDVVFDPTGRLIARYIFFLKRGGGGTV